MPSLREFRAQVDALLSAGTLFEAMDQYAIIFFNVENFKHYNQYYGYPAGDTFLEHMASAVVESFPQRLVARATADQFVVLAKADEVVEGISKVRTAFRREHKDTSIWLRAGYYALGRHDADAGVACDRAKAACDELRGRRDAYMREYDDVLQHRIIWRRYVLEFFDEAIKRGWIRAFCQPIIRVATGETCDVEVLARWIDPGEGVMPPVEFIPVLEEARLVHLLDLAVLRDACRACRELVDAGKPYIPMSVNLSRLDFELCDIVAEVTKILDEYRIPYQNVAVELTESALTGNQEFLREEVDRFRELGIEVWMDDFGSGYSSLNVLKDYTFDMVKIDMAFLRGLEDGGNAPIMLAKVVDMAKELGIKTLVEGVETQEQYEFLRSLGCGRAQGYLFGKPSPLPESIEGLANDAHPPVEPLAKHSFYEDVGRVNLMRPDPHPYIDGRYMPSDVAAAIIRRRGGKDEYLNTNGLFAEFLAETGEEFTEDCRAAIRRCIDSGEWEEYLVRRRDETYTVRARLISEAREYQAFAVLLVVDTYYRSNRRGDGE